MSKKKPSCKNTERCHLWAVNVFGEWIKFNSSKGDGEKYVEEDLYCDDANKVCFIMCRFVTEARQRNVVLQSENTPSVGH